VIHQNTRRWAESDMGRILHGLGIINWARKAYPNVGPIWCSLPILISNHQKKLKFLVQHRTEMGVPFSVRPPCCSKYREGLAIGRRPLERDRGRADMIESLASATMLPPLPHRPRRLPHHPSSLLRRLLSPSLLHAATDPKSSYSATTPAMSSPDVAPVTSAMSSPEVVTAIDPEPQLHHRRPGQALRPFDSVCGPI
jgi:hypothetical protein